MFTIFYDLETSDRFRIGQILSCSFICVDGSFDTVAELSQTIKISRLQLPAPQAILTNRIDVVRHQREAQLSEKAAMLEIARFIERCIGEAGARICFIGYNSTRFDLPFLRTSLIRNGLDPYFQGKLLYRDLLHNVRKLAVSQTSFPRMAAAGGGAANGTNTRLSLTLETVCRALGLLAGRQTHCARDDVHLSIALARLLHSEFSMDVRSYEPYEVRALNQRARKGEVYSLFAPNYDLAAVEIVSKTPMTLLDCDHRYALWIDLEKYREGRANESVRWFSQNNGAFFSDSVPWQDKAWSDLAARALNELSAVNLKNYFSKSTCDIEQDIYRLDISSIDMLRRIIWRGERELREKINDKDLKIVLLRHDLANYQWGGEHDDKVEELLRKYALYRYAGRIRMQKFESPDEGSDQKSEAERQQTLREMIDFIDGAQKAETDPDSARLLQALKDFYLSSDIYRVAGRDLLSGM